MESIIEQLFFGNICPVDELCPKSKEYRQKSDQHYRQCQVFEDALKNLDINLLDTFETLCNEKGMLCLLEEATAFQEGFCMGAALMQEVTQRLSNRT